MPAVEPTKTEDLLPHVSAHRKAYLEQEKSNKIAREEQIKRNEEQMAALAKEIPSPTPEEIRAALSAKSKVQQQVEHVENSDNNGEKKPDDDNDKKPDDKVAKTSTAADQKGGQYKTRDMTGKK